MELLLWQLGGTALAVTVALAVRWHERREMRRFWLASRPGPMSTTMPTVTELNAPEWIQPARQPDAY